MKALRTKLFAASWQRAMLLATLATIEPEHFADANARERVRDVVNWAIREQRKARV